MPHPKWSHCEIINNKPYIVPFKNGKEEQEGKQKRQELTISTHPRLGQYSVKLRSQSKTRFCKNTSKKSFLDQVNSIAGLTSTKPAHEKPNPKNPKTPSLNIDTDLKDMCKLLSELVATFKRGDYTVQTLEVEQSPTTGARMLVVSKDLTVTMDAKKITSGMYGDIFRATGNKGHYEELIVKRNCGGSRKGDLMEVLIQTVLFCDQRAKGKWELSKLAKEYKISPSPFIPNMVYYGKPRNSDRTYIIMESMTETLYDFILHKDTDRPTIINCLKQLCILLQYLQDDFEFMHRDMHANNVMVKYGKAGRKMAKVALIDFGMSRLVMPDEKNSKKKEVLLLGFPSKRSSSRFDRDHIYIGNGGFNSSLDLVTLLTDLYQYKTFNSKLPEIRDLIIVPVMKAIFNKKGEAYKKIRNEYLHKHGKPPNKWGEFGRIEVGKYESLHHIFYQNAVSTTFKECTPTNVLKMLCKLE